jgi:hypothetical protein
MCLSTQADTLTLKNGDRISGQIIKSDGKKITVKTEFMGTVEKKPVRSKSPRLQLPLCATPPSSTPGKPKLTG